jgi:putative ABC transport system permease protein
VALILSAVGLYGVMAFFVRARTPEIGIRLALGAPTASTVGLVFKLGLALVAGGILLGLAGVVVAGSVISGWLFGLGSWDPAALGGASAFLVVVALLACALPMTRAVKVDPVVVQDSE